MADADGPGTTALANALATAGNAVTLRPAPEYTWDATNPPLDDFSCVVHLNGQTYSTPLPNAAQQALADFVQAGGGFVSSEWNGFELRQGQQTTMADLILQSWPGIENCGGCSITYTAASGQAGHPVLAGIPSPFTFFADGHDAGPQVVFGTQPSTVLMTTGGGGPGVMVREFGTGKVVDFSHAANYLTLFHNQRTLQDTTIQQLYANAVAWACGPLQVDIDIKPGSDPNSINCTNEKGVIAVAILTTDDFDATTVDHTTVTFEGASETHVVKSTGLARRHEEDVDGDGDIDLVFHFRQGNTNLDCASTDGTLTGETFDGQAIEGTDAVRMIGG